MKSNVYKTSSIYQWNQKMFLSYAVNVLLPQNFLFMKFLVYTLLDSFQKNGCHYDFLSVLCTCTKI